jgi:hypothetical protein
LVSGDVLGAFSNATYYRIGNVAGPVLFVVFIVGLLAIGKWSARTRHLEAWGASVGPRPRFWNRRPPRFVYLKGLALYVGALVVLFIFTAIVGAIIGTSPGTASLDRPYSAAAMAQYEAGCLHASGNTNYCTCVVARIKANVPWSGFENAIGEVDRGLTPKFPAPMLQDMATCAAIAG